jgi:4-amino-4-deoxy-L-arabinose transferase-like glycosyltransferase
VAAAAILATSVGPLMIGRAATADALLNLLLALTLFDLLRFVEHSTAPAPGQGGLAALRRAALWTGLGVLAKGPIALLVPAGAMLLWAAAARGARWRVLGRAAGDPWSWAIAAAVSLPWYAYALHRHGWAFVDGFLMRHNVERFTGTLEGHGGSLYYYALALPMLMLPWTPLLPPVLASLWRQARQQRLDPGLALLLAWAVFVLAFFSVSGTKLPHYLLYGYTPLAVLSAGWLSRCRRTGVAMLLVFALCAALVALGICSPEIAAWVGSRQKDAYWHALTQRSALPPAPAASWAAVPLAAAAAAAMLAVRRPPLAWAACGTAAFATAVWCNAQLIPWWGETLQGPVRRLAWDAAARGLPLVQWRLHQPSAAFYRDAPAPRRPPQPGEAALTRYDRIDAAGGDKPPRLVVLRQERGLALVVAPP